MASSRGFGCRRVLFAAVAALPSLFLVATLHPLAVSAQDSQLIDCYRFDGVVTPNNTKCPNSNACCGPKANCLSNRLCANPGDPPNRWVRGPCAVKGGWDDGCAQICKYNEFADIFPRVVLCDDGSLCCNNDGQCCEKGKGIFLDENGKVVSARATAATTTYPAVSGSLTTSTQGPSTSTTSSASSSSSTSVLSSSSSTSKTDEPAASTASSTSTPAATSDPSQTASNAPQATSDSPQAASNSDDSIGLKVGLGLGIPLAVLITACVVYFVLRRRGRNASEAAPTPTQPDLGTNHMYSPGMVYAEIPKYPVELMGQPSNELDGNPSAPRYELR